jgi:hypothetical protein
MLSNSSSRRTAGGNTHYDTIASRYRDLLGELLDLRKRWGMIPHAPKGNGFSKPAPPPTIGWLFHLSCAERTGVEPARP